jgi:hypothetical protein
VSEHPAHETTSCGITRLVSEASHHFLPLSRHQFDEAKRVVLRLVQALDIEEKLNIVLENYEELEREVLSMTLHDMIFDPKESQDARAEIFQGTRRLLNLMSAGYMYLEQVGPDLKRLYGNRAHLTNMNQRITDEARDNRGFRVMQPLRNVLQHNALIIREVTHRSDWQRDGEDARRISSSRLLIDQSRAVEGVGRGPKGMHALQSLGAREDLMPLVREYVTGIRRVHDAARGILAQDLPQWDQAIHDLEQRYVTESGDESRIGIAIVRRDQDGTNVEVISISKDIVRHRKRLERKSRSSRPYARYMVAN